MTPQELLLWRKSLKWSQRRATDELGFSVRSYKYLEAGKTSTGARRSTIPLSIELATVELTRRHKSP